MERFSHLASAAALAVLVSATGALATGEMQCQEFDLISTGEFRQIQYVDLDASGGKSVGDKLIGFRVLLDADGSKVGERFFIGSIHEVSADGGDFRRTTEVVNVLQAGAIFTTKDRVAGKDLLSRVNGGTGDYAGATGSVKVTREGTRNVYHFRLNCKRPNPS